MNWYKKAQIDPDLIELKRRLEKVQKDQIKAKIIVDNKKKEFANIKSALAKEKNPVELEELKKKLRLAKSSMINAFRIFKSINKEYWHLSLAFETLDPDYEIENFSDDEEEAETITLPDGSEIKIPNPSEGITDNSYNGLVGDLPSYGFDVMDEADKNVRNEMDAEYKTRKYPLKHLKPL